MIIFVSQFKHFLLINLSMNQTYFSLFSFRESVHHLFLLWLWRTLFTFLLLLGFWFHHLFSLGKYLFFSPTSCIFLRTLLSIDCMSSFLNHLLLFFKGICKSFCLKWIFKRRCEDLRLFTLNLRFFIQEHRLWSVIIILVIWKIWNLEFR